MDGTLVYEENDDNEMIVHLRADSKEIIVADVYVQN